MAKKEKKQKKTTSVKTGHYVSLFLGAAALFLILAFFSYSPQDPGFSHAADSTHIKNWMGLIGAYFTDAFFMIFGLGAVAVPFFLVEYTYLVYRGKEPAWTKIVSSFVLIFVFVSLLGVFLSDMTIAGGTIKAGGALGTVAGQAMLTYLNAWGSLVILLTMFMAGLILGYDIIRIRDALKRMLAGIRRVQAPSLPAKLPSLARNNTGSLNDIVRREESAPKPEKVRSKKKEPQITLSEPEKIDIKDIPIQARLGFEGEYQLPPRSLLNEPDSTGRVITPKELKANAELIRSKLKDFGVDGEILEIKPGPVITMYEFTPAPGIKINKIVNLADDLAMALKASSVRVVAPIPNKDAVGIEIPNRVRELVAFRTIVSGKAFLNATSPLTLALGSDTEGGPVVKDLAKMPHLLIAGATGMGKSVGLNTMILSLLYRCDPSDLKFIMIDPKRIELSHYEGIPHLIHPVVIDPREALPILKWAVAEMENRYGLFKDLGVKSIEAFNRRVKTDNQDAQPTLAMRFEAEGVLGLLPRMVIIIDEMADLMMVNKEVEIYIARLAQMARAAGMHLIIATQRPSVDVITGLIKANFPARISFRVSTKIDGRTILDAHGAEQLLGNGDMLMLSPGESSLIRVHGAFVSEDEVDRVVEFIKEQKEPDYVKDIEEHIEKTLSEESGSAESEGYDSVYDEALEFVTGKGAASISLIQRRFRIGYNRAARIIECMERDGILGPADTAGKPRKVLVRSYEKDMDV